jgi:hypothetical protein
MKEERLGASIFTQFFRAWRYEKLILYVIAEHIEARGNSLCDRCQAHLIKCTNAALAVLIANDFRTKKLGFLI